MKNPAYKQICSSGDPSTGSSISLSNDNRWGLILTGGTVQTAISHTEIGGDDHSRGIMKEREVMLTKLSDVEDGFRLLRERQRILAVAGMNRDRDMPFGKKDPE
jgi:hypothetical protein